MTKKRLSLPQDFMPEDWRDAVLGGPYRHGRWPTPIVVKEGAVFDVSKFRAYRVGVAGKMEWRAARQGSRRYQLILDLKPPGRMAANPRSNFWRRWTCNGQGGWCHLCRFGDGAGDRGTRQGRARRAQAIREELARVSAPDIRKVVPGSPEAAKLKDALIADGLWSQYLEVAIGPTRKFSPRRRPCLRSAGAIMSASARSPPGIIRARNRGCGGSQWQSGRRDSGNDVTCATMKDAARLLLGKAKDNNAASALGPFIRMFDDKFTIDDVRQAVVELEIVGTDNSAGRQIHYGRDQPRSAGTVKQTISEHHIPTVFVLSWAPCSRRPRTRDVKGLRLTHRKAMWCDSTPSWRAGKPGHTPRRRRHGISAFRPDEKPCPARAFKRLKARQARR